MQRRRFLTSIAGLGALVVGCADDRGPASPASRTARGDSAATGAPDSTRGVTPAPSITTTPPSSPATEVTPPTATAVATLEPRGFPIDPATRCGLVSGVTGTRSIAWSAGPTAEEYSRDDQPSADPERANRCGWNARTHVEYEGQPAVDWYVPEGTPVLATMDGVATLIVYTTSNPFEVYGTVREAYLGNPDRTRAPLAPFPGPGGGQGVAVHVENTAFRSDYAHLEVRRTVDSVPADAFLDGYSAATNYIEEFAAMREFGLGTTIARWPVRRGDVVGFTGDTGYSEAPHLHYAIVRLASGRRLCPTAESGFEDAGWLLSA